MLDAVGDEGEKEVCLKIFNNSLWIVELLVIVYDIHMMT